MYVVLILDHVSVHVVVVFVYLYVINLNYFILTISLYNGKIELFTTNQTNCVTCLAEKGLQTYANVVASDHPSNPLSLI